MVDSIFKEKLAAFGVGIALAVTGAAFKVYADTQSIAEMKTQIQEMDTRVRTCAERVSRIEGRVGREHGGM